MKRCNDYLKNSYLFIKKLFSECDHMCHTMSRVKVWFTMHIVYLHRRTIDVATYDALCSEWHQLLLSTSCTTYVARILLQQKVVLTSIGRYTKSHLAGSLATGAILVRTKCRHGIMANL